MSCSYDIDVLPVQVFMGRKLYLIFPASSNDLNVCLIQLNLFCLSDYI